uniref:Translation initiation factor eIF2B subunit gamma n=1 Tax=Mucochytrium quahogii TaxID=96639 RepID=A0A7S2RQA8_9STRA|mmetsp:Transcript_9625/g.15778  ORF Transcript_9625/g.15778 Transcript_9625/m.15778 type:complete len:469 (-) Transcript_9625:1249-2655(-)|eukprot:CAMPEP_0203759234 /NCGR_PEP_ID=MMETSP0098-20131031/12195_1 /ASSEMBLY_ACC=CAM_ASM_000208 /TAXON_ID=96639 /ORGANISM=" , Strain NY0313808BC1" /LENGTH=468 /DNA_ID=CAMNT_0050652049 /DNA_START=123 /DNA_END=1529 /DNA_ORIENTATION=-
MSRSNTISGEITVPFGLTRGRSCPVSRGWQEFQAVVFAGGSGSGLYPLTVDRPKSLLPLGNMPMLFYQLRILEKTGFVEVIVVCEKSESEEIGRVLQNYSGKICVDLFEVEEVEEGEYQGTADVLRALRDRIEGDFFVLTGDVVTTESLHNLADVHRLHDASVTMLLKQHKDVHLKDERKKLRKQTKGVINYFGLVEDEQFNKNRRAGVAMMSSAAQEDPVEIHKQLLSREPNIKLRTDLTDAHIYIVRRRVLDVLCTRGDDILSDKIAGMTSFRNDFLPFFINKLQFQYENADGEALLANLPGDSLDQVVGELGCRKKKSEFSCFALVCNTDVYCCRANTLFSYCLMNHQIANLSLPGLAWPKPKASKFKETIVGESSEIDSSASIRSCVIGAHCKIAAGAKLLNTVVMDHCTIGSDVVLQGCVLSDRVTIEKRCNLSDVQLGVGCTIETAGVRLKSQALVESDFAQ